MTGFARLPAQGRMPVRAWRTMGLRARHAGRRMVHIGGSPGRVATAHALAPAPASTTAIATTTAYARCTDRHAYLEMSPEPMHGSHA
jgi:hypothetical protein